MIRQSQKLVTAQTTWAVSLAEAKSQLNVDNSDKDDYIQSLIYVAQSEIEDYCNLDLTPATYDFYLTDFPKDCIVLPKAPVATISSIKYRDADNAEQTWAATNYYYIPQEQPCRIYYIDSVSKPSLYEDRFDNITIRYTTGYTSPDTVPVKLKQAILIKIADLDSTRTDSPRERFSNWQALCYAYIVPHSTLENR